MEHKKEHSQIDLGEDPIGLLLLKMSVPSIIAMVVMAMYNVIDTFWIARINSQSIAALTICFPIQMILGGLGASTGVGVGSFVSRMFGAGRKEKAHQTAGQVICIAVFWGTVVIGAGLWETEPILRFFGAQGEIIFLAKRYFTTVVFGTPFLFFMMIANYLFRAEGNPNAAMYVMTASAFLNAVLDPFLIFGWGIFPEMGIRGAALATVIAQFAAFSFSVYLLLFRNSRYHLKWEYLFPNIPIIGSVYRVGLPSFIVHLTMGIVLTVYNQRLGDFGPLAIATFGLCFRINGILMMILFGVGHGVMPLVGFNYGANNYKRLKEIVKRAVRISMLIGGVSCLIVEIFARSIIMLFTSDDAFIAIAVPALRIYVATQLLVGPMTVWTNMFNGTGKGLTSMTLLLGRQLMLLIPLIYLLPLCFGLNGVWMAQPVSNTIAFFIVILFADRELRALKHKAE